MNRIMPHLLWLGHAGDGSNYTVLCDAGITAVVQLAAEEPPFLLPRGLTYLRFPLVDGVENSIELLTLAVQSVSTLAALRVPTLICCGAGMSRSPAIAAVAISWAFGDAPEESLRLVTEHHKIDLSPGLWNGVRGVLAFRDDLRTVK